MFHLQPVFKDYIWGGDNLKKLYGKRSPLERLAESWELSTHKDGLCTIEDGHYKEQTLLDYIRRNGKKVLGERCETEDELPILIKLIDAKDNLSVQVHPDDTYAQLNENDLGKTEMWYVLDTKEDAKLIFGFKKDITKELFEDYIKNNKLTDVLNYVPVKRGDVFFIEPGTIHAIGEGIVLAEIQQSSNITYRIFDYDRVDQYGNKRELHLDKAMQVTRFNRINQDKIKYKMQDEDGFSQATLVKCNYFNVQLLEVTQKIILDADGQSFHSLLCLEGTFTLFNEHYSKEVVKGDSFFIPAHFGRYTVQGKGKFILTTI